MGITTNTFMPSLPLCLSVRYSLFRSSISNSNICLNVKQLQQHAPPRLGDVLHCSYCLSESKPCCFEKASVFPWLLSRLFPQSLSLFSFLFIIISLYSFFFSTFRIAGTACVRSDLSGLKYCYAGDVTQNVGTKTCLPHRPLSPPLQRYTDFAINDRKYIYISFFYY